MSIKSFFKSRFFWAVVISVAWAMFHYVPAESIVIIDWYWFGFEFFVFLVVYEIIATWLEKEKTK